MVAREMVHQLFEDRIRKSNAIIAAFQNRGLKEPEKLKLKNFLAKVKQEKFGPPTISVKDVFNWCNARMDVPVEEDTPFVLGVNVEVDDGDKRDLKIVISTKRLLRLMIKTEGVQTDATYKLIWQGYPVLIVGSSDMNQTFHPFAMAFHVVKNIDGKLCGIQDKDEIRNDIECLHLCPDDETFNIVSELFLKKWKEKNDVNITTFTEYCKSVWLTSNRYWYIGSRNYFPITNNGLEATNAVIKKEHTFRERLPVGQFLEVLENAIVKKWSNERDPVNPNYKPFYMKPQHSTKVWTEAYQWAKLEVKILEEKNGNQSVFYLPSSQVKQNISAEMVRSHESAYLKWTSFDEYKTEYSNCIWKMTVSASDSDGSVSTCSCPVFAKKYICKHGLGMLIRMEREKVPNEAKGLPLGQKRKRGQPTRAKKSSFNAISVV
ncbi:hypothetical protein AVEN_169848-1 [Araneus ventricosus]|uniref:SWIM-type domain-containing protein n=1 Tax=Araneus ventricosus TaxID=182803 RepID=A0A4Y2HJN2_ARAVE|nr:hypothetical protein AVEN_169848-1 [Araneus ventricosus]